MTLAFRGSVALAGSVVLGAVLGVGLVLGAPPRPAAAHPLGNFSVNQYEALTFSSDHVSVAAVVDLAELPTLQDRSTVESAGSAEYAASSCTELAAGFAVTVAGEPLVWTVDSSGLDYGPGAAGLRTSRVTCALSAPASLGGPAAVRVANSYRADRVGWREITAVGGGVRLVGSPLPAVSTSDALRNYPADLLSSPLDVRSAVLRVEPAGSVGAVAGLAGSGAADAAAPGAVSAGGTGTTGWLGAAEARLRGIVGGRQLTPLIGLLAVLLATMLGAAHAALPGHGKTVMAAYLAGRRGRKRDALVVGATVTLTHTGAVLVLGLLLTSAAAVAGEQVLGWLGLVSGVLVLAVGVTMIASRFRRGPHDHAHGQGHGHQHFAHAHHLAADHDHNRHDAAGHGHHASAAPHHSHGAHGTHRHSDRPSRLGIAGIGIAGGLVPSPSALIVLLGAIGLGRTTFGVLLVIFYGLGMAATLTAAGLLLLRIQRRLASRAGTSVWARLAGRLSTVAPATTAWLVLLLGIGLAGRAAAGLL